MSAAPEVSQEALFDFCYLVEGELSSIEGQLSTLCIEPHNFNALDSLFLSVESIRDGAQICTIQPLFELAKAIEQIVLSLRRRDLDFIPELKEAMLLGVDQINYGAESLSNGFELDNDQCTTYTMLFTAIANSSQEELPTIADVAVSMFSGKIDQAIKHAPESILEIIPPKKTPNFSGVSRQADELRYFQDIAQKVDGKIPEWRKRSTKSLELALCINEQLGNAVDQAQLTAAVFVHDMGMAFLPDGCLIKSTPFTENERILLHDHPNFAYEWLTWNSDWQVAAKIIRQHHERPDGKGYPQKLKDFHIGAQIVAVVDAFYSMTNARSDREHQRTILRAASEINAKQGSQFIEAVVLGFNIALQTHDMAYWQTT